MAKDKFERIISFLLGASWAVVLFGALLTFKIFSFLGFITAFFISLFYVFFALFMILALDAFVINREKLHEMKKQTKILEEINAN